MLIGKARHANVTYDKCANWWYGRRRCIVSDSQSFQVIGRSYLRNVVIKCALIFIIGLVATAGIFLLLTRQPIGPTYGAGFRMLAQLEQDLFYKSLVVYGSTVLVTLVCIAFITMFYSHHVVGPVYRLRLFAGQIMSGDLRDRVTLRPTDVGQPLAREINRMNEQFAQTFGAIQREIEALEKQVDILEKAGTGSRENLQEIEAGSERISVLISKYRL